MEKSPKVYAEEDLYVLLRPLTNKKGMTLRSSIESPICDVRIITSGGSTIPAHSSVLGSVSTVLEKIMDRPREHQYADKIVPILGVPCDSVFSFVRCLYSSRCTEEEMNKYGIHLLALSHVYRVPKLKQRCSKGLIKQLTIENVIDILQLTKLCDVPDLYVKCMKLVSENFKAVEATEGWKFLQDHDPSLELEILQFMDEAESRQKRMSKKIEERSLYLELSEAMECLEHIFTEGCTSVGPCDVEVTKNKEPCKKFCTCQGLQVLIRHFVQCKKRVNGGCSRCKRMWQLLQLHSSVCDNSDLCRVPLCRDFKLRREVSTNKGELDARWKLLVKKVVAAKVMSSLSLPKREEAANVGTVKKMRL
ncbi:hypothetical protein MKX01_017106 [Papaver californicum]|nr:hypothetical protein MKX01_017106 [Papaver californicum]